MKARLYRAWPLWSILVVQAVLTLPWLWRTGPFSDEALYLDAGHQQWAHWLHHGDLPSYAQWFSGAPVLYPPLGAGADALGGLPAARALSLALMLATTALVYLIGERLFGRAAGLLGAAPFAVCGLVVHYGAFATFGPMALALLAASAWAAVKLSDAAPAWLPACAAALVAANATKYATVAWDPLVVGIGALHGWVQDRWHGVGRAASVALTVVVLDVGMLMLGGSDYGRGVAVTTTFRSIRWGVPSAPDAVLIRALAMTGVLVLLAAAAVALSLVRRARVATTLLLCLLLLAALIAPIDQARIHELASLDKNLGFGLPFAAVAAGHALAQARAWLAGRAAWGRVAAVATTATAVLTVLVTGRMQNVQFRGPGIVVASKIVTTMQRSYRQRTYILSDGGARMEQYYLPAIGPGWWMASFVPNAAQDAWIDGRICSGQVSVVVLRMTAGAYDHAYDLEILRLIDRMRRYRLAAVAGQGAHSTQVWTAGRLAPVTGGCS